MTLEIVAINPLLTSGAYCLGGIYTSRFEFLPNKTDTMPVISMIIGRPLGRPSN